MFTLRSVIIIGLMDHKHLPQGASNVRSFNGFCVCGSRFSTLPLVLVQLLYICLLVQKLSVGNTMMADPGATAPEGIPTNSPVFHGTDL